MKNQHEWFIHVPWGKLALVGNGHPDGEPVFLVHGRQDSSSVFEPLIEQMSRAYNYVALDMPGNGLSDAFPLGPKLTKLHFLSAMELAINHLGWDRFMFIGHSMGCEQGLFYNVIHPGQITSMILLDAGPTLMRMQVEDHVEYQRYYDSYYEDYNWENFERKPYVREMALQALERHRDLTRNQGEIIIARNFHGFPFYNNDKSIKELNEDEGQNDEANGTQNAEQETVAPNPPAPGRMSGFIERMRRCGEVGYLSWDNRLKNLAAPNYGNDYYFALFKTIPPTLLIAASDGAKKVPPNPKWRQGVKELLNRMATLDNFHSVEVEGGHDVHFTHPERVVPYINAFLKDSKVFSKL